MGSRAGVIKGVAAHLGLSVDDYLARIQAGDLWCTACRSWHARDEFGKDVHRGSGRASVCLNSRHTGKPRGWHGRPNINPLTGKPGPAPGKKHQHG